MATLQRVPQREYRAAPGAGFGHEAATKYGKFLERKLRNKPRDPHEIVELARPETSPIHERFTWDDTEAAVRWRVEEARHLVSHIVVSTPKPDGEVVEARAFFNVTTENGESKRGYISSRQVWARPGLAEQVREAALRELRGWTDRYAIYEELSDVVGRVAEVLAEAEAA